MNMNCPRCQSVVPPASPFCPQCGLPATMVGGVGNAGVGAASAAIPSSPRAKVGIGIIILLALMGVGLLGVTTAGVLKLTRPGTSNSAIVARSGLPSVDSISAKADSRPTDALRVESNQQPTDTLSKDGSQIMMPDDIRKWLEHLERIENLRGEISRKQLARSLTMLTSLSVGASLDGIKELMAEEATGGNYPSGEMPDSPAQDAQQDLKDFNDAWAALNQDFHSFPPPAECVPIRDQYDLVLNGTGSMIADIYGMIDKASTDREGALAGLMGMQGQSKNRIDVPAQKSDQLVQGICHRYQTLKWFKISADFGEMPLTRFGF